MSYNSAKIKTDKQLHDDKEYLQHCLELNGWWLLDNRPIAVARILDHYGQFKGISEAIDFFEKPYKYEDKMRFIVEDINGRP